MKVMHWRLLQVCLLIAAYAIATAMAAAELREAEVFRDAPRSSRFGGKTAATMAKVPPNDSRGSMNAQRARAVAARNRVIDNDPTNGGAATQPRMSRRRYDEPTAPVAQLITQHETPNHDVPAAAPKGQRMRSRERGPPMVAAAALNSYMQTAGSVPTGSAPTGNVRYTSRGHALSIVHEAQPDLNLNQQNGSSASKVVASARSRSNGRKSAATATTTTTTTTTTTPRPSLMGNLSFRNPFNFFPTNFWSLSNPPSAPSTTKKPPKKYSPAISATTPSSKAQKLSYLKAKAVAKPTKVAATLTSAAKQGSADGPFRIALPTFSFFNENNDNTNKDKAKSQDGDGDKEKRDASENLRVRFNCPRESEVRFQLFPKICKNDKDCSVWNRGELCCDIFGAKSCISGVPKPLEETPHAPILGVIPRKCPSRPLAELWWDVQECHRDMDCWPRVCCPDGYRRYCRTSQPELEIVPAPFKRSFNYLTEYLECTAPPPPIFDLHPKACTSTLDCFPNVCCQEAGLRHCRPPKKSVLTLMANFLNVDFVKRLTQNIIIK